MEKPKYVIVLLCTMCLLRLRAHADPPSGPRPGWSKVAVGHLFRQPNASEAMSLLINSGAIEVNDYDIATIAAVPEAGIKGLERAAAARSLEFSRHDDYDVMELPGGRIDARLGTAQSNPGKSLGAPYAAGEHGLYVMQFSGPIKAEWLLFLKALGVDPIQYIAWNAYIVAATPETMSAARQQTFVHFVDIVHPFLKLAWFAGNDARESIVEIATQPGSDRTEAAIQALSSSPLTSERLTSYSKRLYGRFRLEHHDAVLSQPLVLAVYQPSQTSLSDERVTNAVAGRIGTDGFPTGAGSYKTWLANHCGYCTNLQADGFWVGIADTGLDCGSNCSASARHADLPAGRIYYGRDFSESQHSDPADNTTDLTDVIAHGTMVAGVVGGNPQNGATTDNEGFFHGMGVAPSSGIFATKAYIFQAGDLTNNRTTGIDLLTQDAREPSSRPTPGGPIAYIQNHSHNEYDNSGNCSKTFDGLYTDISQAYDNAVRSSLPITLTVSSGNIWQQPFCRQDERLTLPPATAKNVISVGAVESPRPVPWLCHGVPSDAFSNLSSVGKHGTAMAGWFKPDLVAPAVDIASAKSASTSATTYCFTSGPAYNDPSHTVIPAATYFGSSGTSFAAPVAAGAAVLASRVYAEAIAPNCGNTSTCNPAAARPALIKAMLVASARSIRGGEDRATASAWIPNNQFFRGQLIHPRTMNGHYYYATPQNDAINIAYSAATEPAWTTGAGDVVFDGGILPMLWREATWKTNFAYSQFSTVNPTVWNGHFYQAVTATSSASEPIWPTASGAMTSDGKWREYGSNIIGGIPNNQQGFGRVQLDDLLNPYPAHVYDNESHTVSSVSQSGPFDYIIHDSSKAVRVVLTWSDPAAQAGATTPLVNDLNLIVDVGNTCTRFRGNIMVNDESQPLNCTATLSDSLNNVEEVIFQPSAVSGSQFSITITDATSNGTSQPYALVVSNAYPAGSSAPPSTPSSITATAITTTRVDLTWQSASSATSYDLQRSHDAAAFETIATPASASYSDTTAVANKTYVYRVRARNAAFVSDWAPADIATTVLFSDNPIITQSTVVSTSHINELRTAINALRAAAALPPYSFTEPTLTTHIVKATHINELRAALDAARASIGLSPIAYTDPTLAAHITPVRGVHVSQLRTGVQ